MSMHEQIKFIIAMYFLKNPEIIARELGEDPAAPELQALLGACLIPSNWTDQYDEDETPSELQEWDGAYHQDWFLTQDCFDLLDRAGICDYDFFVVNVTWNEEGVQDVALEIR